MDDSDSESPVRVGCETVNVVPVASGTVLPAITGKTKKVPIAKRTATRHGSLEPISI